MTQSEPLGTAHREDPMDANAYTRPDRDAAAAALNDIDDTSDELKDELLTDLLVLSYPRPSAQHN